MCLMVFAPCGGIRARTRKISGPAAPSVLVTLRLGGRRAQLEAFWTSSDQLILHIVTFNRPAHTPFLLCCDFSECVFALGGPP